MQPSLIQKESPTKLLTSVFIDVVGFSLVAENLGSEVCFNHLSRLLFIVRRQVEAFGGRVEKTMGDGILCIFGDGNECETNQCYRALAAAVSIQRLCLDRDLQANLKAQPILPLRIGINTSEVYVGELFGTESALIGHGVNYANRLESACDGYSILIGHETYQRIQDFKALDVEPRKRFIQVKHNPKLIEAYECNPFEMRSELLDQAIDTYRKFVGIMREDVRWPVPSSYRAEVFSIAGVGELVDFSEKGIGIKLNTYLSRGIQIRFEIRFADEKINQMLKSHGLHIVVGQIRWGKPLGGSFLHGALLQFSKPREGRQFVRLLKALLSQEA